APNTKSRLAPTYSPSSPTPTPTRYPTKGPRALPKSCAVTYKLITLLTRFVPIATRPTTESRQTESVTPATKTPVSSKIKRCGPDAQANPAKPAAMAAADTSTARSAPTRSPTAPARGPQAISATHRTPSSSPDSVAAPKTVPKRPTDSP